jgi:serine/threonine-protein kinase RsbT
MTYERVEIGCELDLQTATLRCRQFALQAGLPALAVQRLATATSELTRNIYKYAGGRGLVLLSMTQQAGQAWLQVEVIDDGPGIEKLDQAMQDHYSTSGTLGLGLPGVQRLVDYFEISSEPGVGTHITIRMRCPTVGIQTR